MGKWRECGAFVLGFLLLSNTAFSVAQETQQPSSVGSTIRVNVDRVAVGVTVADTHGHFIQGLHREDFRVYDNGVEQQVTDFLPSEETAQVVLLMECGPAAIFVKPFALQVADTFLSSIAPSDRVAIISYSNTPKLELDFTSNKAEASAAIRGISFMSGFANLNLIKSVTATLDWLATLPGKKTVVLLSSGLDDSTSSDLEVIQRKLRASNTRIIAVSVVGDLRKTVKWKKLSADERDKQREVKQGFVEADSNLRELATATGGRVYLPKNTKQFTNAYTEIAQLIRNEYLLEFVPPSNDGQLHSLKVKVRHSWYHVNYRQAYLAPAPASQELLR
jgi:VWFA-related protein